MKRIFWGLLAIVLVGTSIVGYWIYVRYIRVPPQQYLSVTVTRGDLQHLVHARGDVVAEDVRDLSFPLSGTVEDVPVTEGKTVSAGTLLMAIDTSDAQLQLSKLFTDMLQARAGTEAARSQLQQALSARDAEAARLDELKRGARPEQLDVQQARVTGAEQSLADAETTMENTIRNAYTKADDSIRNVADQTIQNPRSSDPVLGFILSDSQVKRAIELDRPNMETLLTGWKTNLTRLSATTLTAQTSDAKNRLTLVKSFLDQLAYALNSAIPSSSVTQTTIDTWKTNLSSARAAIDASITSLASSEASLRTATSARDVAVNELTLLKAGTVDKQITAQEAVVKRADAAIASQHSVVRQLESAESGVSAQMSLVREQITKSRIVAPSQGRITKLWRKAGEVAVAGTPAVRFTTTEVKIQTDISELDIPGILATGSNSSTIMFDAFPNQSFHGIVQNVEAQEIYKDTDTYYRTNIRVDDPPSLLRTGMSADVVILVAKKRNVITVPAFVIQNDPDGDYVMVLRNNEHVRQNVTKGISDGDFTEIVSGLKDGETVFAPTQ